MIAIIESSKIAFSETKLISLPQHFCNKLTLIKVLFFNNNFNHRKHWDFTIEMKFYV